MTSKRKSSFFSLGGFILSALLFSFASEGMAISPAAAVSSAQSVPIPKRSEVLRQSDALQILESDPVATASLEALRETGSERLYEPGRTDVDACYGKNDTRCAAVVIVDKGAATRETVNPDPTGEILSSHAAIKSESTELLSSLGVESSVGSCRRVRKSLTASPTTHTCDIRVGVREVGALEEKTCFMNLATLTQKESTYRCEVENFREFDAVVSVPVVPSFTYTTTVTCLEGKRNAETKSCTVIRNKSTVLRKEATCITPHYRAVKKTCRRVLTVKPEATCKPGEEVSVTVTDSGTLTEDDVPGCDRLRLSYRCNAEGEPRVTVATNGGGGSDFSIAFESADSVIDKVLFPGGNTLYFYGTRSCEGQNCIAAVTMEVYMGKADSRLFFGELKANLYFTKFSLTSETESWEETCE